ncbi:MAG: hypothetical protein ACOX2X_04510 [Peptococcia bacterium]
MLHIILEDDVIASIRHEIKQMSTKQLSIVEELIKREKQKRNAIIFQEWLDQVEEIKSEYT